MPFQQHITAARKAYETSFNSTL